MQARVNGRPAAAVGIQLTPSANALATANAVKAKVKELSKFFPPGVRVDFPYDSSEFVRISIQEVVKTLIEAIVMVFLVIFLFLQNLRATFIPTIVVPVALLGTFAVMYALGFSINVLTMFGLVLAVGVLVDDAIVVVENVERIMSEEGLSPRDATRKAMEQITGALIGISLVLTAVFIPMAFFGGSVGAIYRQFSLAMISCMLFSIFLAMSLTPALCASLLQPVEKGHHQRKQGFFGWFNRGFLATRKNYEGLLARTINKAPRYLLIYLVIVLAVGWLYVRLPSSFLPDEDQGYFITSIQLPVGATQQRTRDVLQQVETLLFEPAGSRGHGGRRRFQLQRPGAKHGTGVCAFERLEPAPRRPHSVQAIIGRAFMALSQIKDAIIYPINPPPIPELGISSGFDFELEDQAGLGHEKLMQARDQLSALAAKNPDIAQLRLQGLEDTPQLKVDIDQAKASALGVSLADLNTALTTYFGSDYINNFVNGNRVQRVIAQLDAPYRMLPQDVSKVYVRNNRARWFRWPAWPRCIGFTARRRWNITTACHRWNSSVPPRRAKAPARPWTPWKNWPNNCPRALATNGPASLSRNVSRPASALALRAVAHRGVPVLAALYENWSIPLAVILVVPLGIIGALLAATVRGLPNDVFFKVGLLTIVGLSAKNAILIIEFAKDLQAQGKGLIEATLEAAHLRLRPILMTSLAFILGVLPLALSTGAGSASRHDIGTGVAGGMLSATVLAVIFVPVFFVVIRRIFKSQKPTHTMMAPKPSGLDDGDENDQPAKP